MFFHQPGEAVRERHYIFPDTRPTPGSFGTLSSIAAEVFGHRSHHTEIHLKGIESKIADLERLAAQLRRIKNSCPGRGLIADCRIPAALSPSRGKTG